MKKIIIPRENKRLKTLKAGEQIFVSGVIYTARDQAHKKLITAAKNKKVLVFDLEGKIIYYCGPTPNSKDKIIGSCGPTTSSRMDNFTKSLLDKGLLGMIGKGRRTKKVHELIKKYKSIYFIAPAGCGALLSKKVSAKKLVCFAELGPEAIYELKVRDFPLLVAIDSKGKSIYETLD